MACPPALLSSLNKTLTRDKSRLTITLEVGTKGKLSPRLVITDLEMLDWLSTLGYNVNKVLDSGYIDNLSYTGNRPTWEFDIGAYPPDAPAESLPPRTNPARARRRAPRAAATAPSLPPKPVKEAPVASAPKEDKEIKEAPPEKPKATRKPRQRKTTKTTKTKK